VTGLARWVNEADLTDTPALRNLALPTGVTLGDCCAASTDYLWRASGCRYDAREVTVRPSRLVAGCRHSWGALDPSQRIAGYSLGESDWIREINLEGPASNVSVIVDGVQLAETEFVLVDGYRLVRVGQSWPCCQDLSLPDGAPGTWSVRHTAGVLPPPLGRLAARELTVEVALFHSGKPSKLPAGTTSITRTGITIQMRQPKRANGGDSGTTGLPTVELFLDAVNPGRQRQGALVLSPDTLAGGRIS
jgi:hypothetical protein